jgi:hemolysin activation/secretion protein
MGDQLFLYYMMTNGELNNYNARYEIPIDGYASNGTILGVSFNKMDYELGAPFDQYDSYGSARTFQIYTKTPLKRMLHNNLYLKSSVEIRDLSDEVGIFNQDTEKSSEVIRVGLAGNYRTNKTASRYGLTQSVGWMHMDSETAKEYDYYKTEGPFQKTEASFYHIINSNKRVSFVFNASAQYAWTNLDSSEKFYIGGYNGVRAFPQGEAGGDNGLLGSFEARWKVDPDHDIKLATFIDAGRVEYNKDSSNDDNFRNLSGWGLGLLWTDTKKTSARLDVAFPISGDNEENSSKIWWFQLIQRI